MKLSSLIPKRMCGFIYYSLSSSIFIFILILVSAFLTWLFRGWLVVPNVDFEFPTNFVFQPCEQPGVCSYPWALIDLRRSGESLLIPGVEYSAASRFRISDSESNRLAGMFMVKFSLETSDGRVLSTCTTSTSMPYRSDFIRTTRWILFWPLMIFGLLDDYHSIRVVCPDPLRFSDRRDSDLRFRVEIQNIGVQLVNDGRLELFGHLRGLQYYLYWWPLVSTFFIFFATFWCCVTTSCGLWLFQSRRKKPALVEPTKIAAPVPPTPSPLEPKKDNPASFFDDEPPIDVRGGQPTYSSILGRPRDNGEIFCVQRRGNGSSGLQKSLLDFDG